MIIYISSYSLQDMSFPAIELITRIFLRILINLSHYAIVKSDELNDPIQTPLWFPVIYNECILDSSKMGTSFTLRAEICKSRKLFSSFTSLRQAYRAATTAAAQNLSYDDHNQAVEEKLFFPREPKGPTVQTEIPGPKAREAITRLDRIYDTRSLNMMANYDKSIGN